MADFPNKAQMLNAEERLRRKYPDHEIFRADYCSDSRWRDGLMELFGKSREEAIAEMRGAQLAHAIVAHQKHWRT